MPRTATIDRQTAETKIHLELVLDGGGQSQIATGVGFFDHMLALLAKHAAFDLTVQAAGDLKSISTTPWKTWAFAWARPSTRPWATGPASAATAIPRCPWKKRWPPAPSTWAGGPISSSRPSSPRPRSACSTASWWRVLAGVATNALCNLHLVVHHGAQRPSHRRVPLQGGRPGPAYGRRARSPHARRAQHQGRSCNRGIRDWGLGIRKAHGAPRLAGRRRRWECKGQGEGPRSPRLRGLTLALSQRRRLIPFPTKKSRFVV